MEKITVDKISEARYRVRVESRSTTEHSITLSTSYYQRLTGGAVSPEELIRKSFEFLLQREPNTSILRSFDLPLIGSYFPEYEEQIKSLL